MTKKLFVLLLAIAPFMAFAQNNTVAYVNAAEVFSLMPEISDIENQLSKKQEEIASTGEALEAEYAKKVDEFQKSIDTASESTKADLQKQISQIEERFQIFQQNSYTEMNDLRQKLLAPIQEKISKAIKQVGDEKGYAYIFDISTQQSPIVYINDSSVDATSEVKAKLGI